MIIHSFSAEIVVQHAGSSKCGTRKTQNTQKSPKNTKITKTHCPNKKKMQKVQKTTEAKKNIGKGGKDCSTPL